jgi:diphthamide biosynthesis protein 2
VGTLGVAGYKNAISAVRAMIEEAGKTCYIFLVGKPSPAKLANFPEIEVG